MLGNESHSSIQDGTVTMDLGKEDRLVGIPPSGEPPDSASTSNATILTKNAMCVCTVDCGCTMARPELSTFQWFQNGVEVETSQNHSCINNHYEPLDGGRFVFECILAGNLQAFTTYS